jgi:predicted secreted protein
MAKIPRGKKTVLNLSSRTLSETEYILLGEGLSFCPKIKSHVMINLAEEVFRFTLRMRLKEYFNAENDSQNSSDSFKQDLPFFNRSQSTFTLPCGRDLYLDFYLEAITQEILQNHSYKSRFSNISKTEYDVLKSLSNDPSIVITKADKSATL